MVDGLGGGGADMISERGRRLWGLCARKFLDPSLRSFHVLRYY
jgi:hypothetical protein